MAAANTIGWSAAKGTPPEKPRLPEAFLPAIVSFIIICLFLLVIGKKKRKMPERLNPKPRNLPWDKLFSIADQTIRETIRDLPAEIKKHAQQVPYLLEKWSPDDDVLGRYLGFEEGGVSEALGPILIYIGNHASLCEEEELDFATEIRRTYLHELAHHLGLDESEIEERGLD